MKKYKTDREQNFGKYRRYLILLDIIKDFIEETNGHSRKQRKFNPDLEDIDTELEAVSNNMEQRLNILIKKLITTEDNKRYKKKRCKNEEGNWEMLS